MTYIYPFRLNDEERKKLDRLVKERGYRRPDIFRQRLNELYRKEFPHYTELPGDEPLEDKITDAKYCTDMLGGVVEGDFCIWKANSGAENKTLLKNIKDQKL